VAFISFVDLNQLMEGPNHLVAQSRYSLTVSFSIPSPPPPPPQQQKKFKPLVGTRLKHQLIKVQIISMLTSTGSLSRTRNNKDDPDLCCRSIWPRCQQTPCSQHGYLPSYFISLSSLCVTGEEHPELAS
jgi:hypothetical protein